MKTILSQQQMALTIKRLAHQVAENHAPFTDTVIIGIQPRGVLFSDKVVAIIKFSVCFHLQWQHFPLSLAPKPGRLHTHYYN